MSYVQKQLANLPLPGMNQTQLWHLAESDEYVTTDFQHGITLWEMDRLLWTISRLRTLKSHDDSVTGVIEVKKIYKLVELSCKLSCSLDGRLRLYKRDDFMPSVESREPYIETSDKKFWNGIVGNQE